MSARRPLRGCDLTHPALVTQEICTPPYLSLPHGESLAQKGHGDALDFDQHRRIRGVDSLKRS